MIDNLDNRKIQHPLVLERDFMNLDRMLTPKRVAVIGVSLSNKRHPANVIFRKVGLRFPITAYAVNPKGGVLEGELVHKSLTDVPEPVDLVVIAARAEYVPDLLAECIRAKAGGAVVISGGFSEVGNQALQDKLTDIAKKADFPFIGPNCLGTYAPGVVDTTFIPQERFMAPQKGGVALISQSGGFLLDLLVKLSVYRIGVSQAISIGNKALIKETDLLEYLDQDMNTQVIAFYIEGFEAGEGRKFVQAARKCSKPVVVLKAGKTAAGTAAVSSPTASIAGDYRVFSEVLAQHGIVEAQNEYELLSYCEVLHYYPRNIQGNVGIITISGGHGAAVSDVCAKHGFKLPPIPPAVQERIRERLTPSVRNIASLNNPMDLTGSAVDEDFVAAYEELNTVPEIDSILMLVLPYPPGISLDLGAKVSSPSRKRVKPLVAYVPHIDKYQMFVEGFEVNQVQVSDSIDGAVKMLDAMRRYNPC